MNTNDNLYAHLSQGFPADRNSVAIEAPHRNYSWNDLDAISGRMASLFLSLGLQRGDRVAVQVEKSPEALALYLATLRAGLVYLPLNTAYTEPEVAYFVGDAEPALLVCDPANLGWMQTLADGVSARAVLTLGADGEGTLVQQAAGQSPDFASAVMKADELAAILYTSGTTGRSKGAMLSHGNLLSNAQVLNRYWQWSADDVLLHMLPLFHVHGLFVAANGALLAGARQIWRAKFTADDALECLPRATVVMGVPTYYVRLLGDPRFGRDTCARLRLAVSGSAPLLVETFNDFRERTGLTILERYGMSETNMLTSNPYEAAGGERLAGTVGRPLPGVGVRVVNDADEPVVVGEIGHVQVRGPNVFSGYWRMPEKTQESFTVDGWFRTGDMGRFGGDGVPADYLSIVGRSKDLIITGGYNVYPKEIEEVIDALPGVLESAVIGVPHADFGEAVTAVVVPRDGAELDTAAMVAELRRQLANFKVPKQVHVVPALPRNTMGKVQKVELRRQYGG